LAIAASVAMASFTWGPASTNAADELAQQVRNLASSDFAVRQEATLRLQAAGDRAVPALAAAVAQGDAETRTRSLRILMSHAMSAEQSLREPANRVLADLAKTTDSRVATLATGSLLRIREAASSAAAAELTRLGATVMPVQNAEPLTFNVQIRQTWSGGDERLSLLSELGTIPWLSMENAPVTDAALVQVARLAALGPGPTKLYLGASGITGTGLSRLSPLTRLQYLSLKQLPIDDAKLATLPGFPELLYFGLDGTKITDRGLVELKRYPQLQVLWLDNTAVTDAGMVHLKSLMNLRTLYLPGTRAVGPGLADLRHSPSLTSLSLKGTKLAPDSLKHIAHLEQLESLGLDHTNITDDQLADLAGLSRLRILWLSNTDITDAGVDHLKALRGLQILHLSGTEVSSEASVELQRALPNCQVTLTGRQEQPALPQNLPPRAPVVPGAVP
jgi:hypothetical protein